MPPKHTKPKFPVLIQIGRTNQQNVWEAHDPDVASQRIKQLEDDQGVTWFYAFAVTGYRLFKVKKTAVVIEEPNEEGTV